MSIRRLRPRGTAQLNSWAVPAASSCYGAAPLGASWNRFLLAKTWTHFVTLTTNEPSRAAKSSVVAFSTVLKAERFMADRLRNFDARVNRALIGPKWTRRPQQRLEAVCILEKPASNPHWHLLVNMRCNKPREDFADVAQKVWHDLVPAGSVDIQPVSNMGALSNYVLKTKPYMGGGHRMFFLPR